jgi:exodeoxyribonuclease X
MPPEARAVHHISDRDVRCVAHPVEGLRRLEEGAPAYYVAHNAKFEQAFFTGASAPWICTKCN